MLIYLGKLSFYSRNVALVLEKVTGRVSPQFHVYFDPGFHTVKQDGFESLWSVRSVFINQIGKIGKNKLL